MQSLSFEHQSYRDLGSEDKKRVPKPTRLRNVCKWWYIPVLLVAFVIYLVLRMGAICMKEGPCQLKGADYATEGGPQSDVESQLKGADYTTEGEPPSDDESQLKGADYDTEEEPLSDVESQLKGADYANLYTGARIYDFSQTANYGSKVYGGFLWQLKRNPELVIEKPESYVMPGKCWPMRGSQGYVTIRLSSPISLSAVSYEHAPLKSLRPEDVVSAPKEIEISAGMDPKRLHVMGVYKFEEVAESGPVTVVSVPPSESGEDDKVQFLKFSVLDNFGERRFTCLYRIRVFGKV